MLLALHKSKENEDHISRLKAKYLGDDLITAIRTFKLDGETYVYEKGSETGTLVYIYELSSSDSIKIIDHLKGYGKKEDVNRKLFQTRFGYAWVYLKDNPNKKKKSS